MLEQKDPGSIEELGLDIDLEERGFESVWHESGDLTLSQDQLMKMLHEETAALLVVGGTLRVEGHLGIDEQHGVHADGDITCNSLWIGMGVLSGSQLHARDFAVFSVTPDEMLESCDLVGAKTTLLLYTAEEPACVKEAEFRLDLLDLEDADALCSLCEENFDMVLAALRLGTEIDDSWVKAHS